MLWIILIASLVPYLGNEAFRSPVSFICTIGIYLIVLVYLMLDMGTSKMILDKSYVVFRSSKHFMFYCLWIFVSFLILIFVYNDARPSFYSIAKVFESISTAILAFIILPSIIWPGRIRQLWYALMLIAAFTGFTAILSTLFKVNSFLGLPLLNYSVSPIVNIPATAGPFYDINTFAIILVLGVVGSWYFITKREKRLLAITSMSICLVALFFTWSRTMFVTVPLLIYTSSFIKSSFRRKVWMIIGILILPVIAVVLAFTVEPIRTLFAVDSGITGRRVVWPAAIAAIKARPFSGHGIGLETVYNTMAAYGGKYEGKALTTHNGFLEVGIQMGAVAIVAFFSIFVVSVVRLLRSKIDIYEKRAIGSGIATVFLGIATGSNSLLGITYITMVLGILCGLGNLSSLEEAQHDVTDERKR